MLHVGQIGVVGPVHSGVADADAQLMAAATVIDATAPYLIARSRRVTEWRPGIVSSGRAISKF